MESLLFPLFLTITGLVGYGVWESFRVRLVRYELRSQRVKPSENLRIAHLSDLHMTRLGSRELKVLEMVKGFRPDIIALTGDLIPLGKGLKAAEVFLKSLSEIAPVFAVEGNSEVVNGVSQFFARLLKDLGGCWLDNDAVQFREGVWIAGTADPHWHRDNIVKALSNVPEKVFCILLSHSPDVACYPEAKKVDLILCGHTHGGQVRLPLIGPLYTRTRYIPRAWAWGKHKLAERTTLITTSGVGTTRLPIRFLCPPEVVGLTIKPITSRSE
ncbi:MAG: metallophosphoesterase [Armatimonadota bacterium]|nr:metallophosphoesterase [Armatimonadota bacterium]MDW8142031.1 metallophosphoesterase [Armatimonadota bacterium]